MAVYQGARQRASLPLGLDAALRTSAGRGRATSSRATSSRATSKRATSSRATAGRSAATRATGHSRPSSVGIALAAIVIVFIAAFLSLSQSVRVAATGYDIVRLVSERDRLTAIKQDLQSDVDRLRGEPAIRKQALDAGLGQLGAPLHIPAR
jgi:hypothetical protein